jgi:succinate-semialdehyde dehydrogenase/glutarate-semialdehyde dehydrogenase
VLKFGGSARFIDFDDAEISQCLPDARVRQPHPGAGRVYDAFTKLLAETAGAIKVADGFEPGAVIGPLIDQSGQSLATRKSRLYSQNGGRIVLRIYFRARVVGHSFGLSSVPDAF